VTGSGLGLAGIVAGQTAFIRVTARDKAGNLRNSSTDSFEFTITVDATVEKIGTCVTEAGSPGVYTGSYTVTKAGVMTLTITIRGEKLNVAGPGVIVAGPVSNLKTTFSGDGLTTTIAGAAATIVIDAKDAFGNAVPVTDGDEQFALVVGDADPILANMLNGPLVRPGGYCPSRHRHAFEPSFVELNGIL